MFRSLRPSQIAVDTTAGALFVLVGVPLEIVWGLPDTTTVAGAAVAALAFGAALAVRRLAPGLSLAIAWAGAVVQMAALAGPRPSDLAVFAVLYAAAAYGSRRVYWAALASAVVGAVVITLYLYGVVGALTLQRLPTAFAVLAAAGFALGLAWVTGALVRTLLRASESRRARLEAEAEAAAEQERVRIARDMHDVVAHSLAVVVAQADGARYAAAADPRAADAALQTISGTARAALADVRLLLTQLRRSAGPDAADVRTLPQPALAEVDALYAQVRAAGVDLRVAVDPPPPGEPPAAVQLAVYRILQEALTNALRHGAAGVVSVTLAWRGRGVDLTVQNPRAGDAPTAGGHGLIGMRERAQLAGGTLEAGPSGTTWLVRAHLPIGAAA